MPVRHEDIDCKTLYAQNYFIFQKLWFVVLFDNKEEESQRYSQALEIERISKGRNLVFITTCGCDLTCLVVA